MPYLPGRRKRRTEVEKKEEEHHAPPLDLDVERLRRACEELETVNRRIRESHVEMILNLAIAAEYKDSDTGNHILRISDYATELGKALHLSSEELELLRYASPMHDIGKIGIPDKILQKPAKLDPDEWEVMKQHTVIGWRMFKNSSSPILQKVSEIALYHHEKFDGKGYPQGIKGTDIPLFGRIISLVDVFDALVSKRCYKEEWTFHDSLAEIEKGSGGHFDPALVKAFLKIEKKIEKIHQANLSIQAFVKDFEKAKERLQ